MAEGGVEMSGKTFTAWISKYALTQGIFEATAEMGGFDGMIHVRQDRGSDSFFHGEGKEWHRTREGAVRRANEMRLKQILTMEAKLLKLRSMTF